MQDDSTWKNLTQDQCQEILSDPDSVTLQRQKALFRSAEIFQNEQNLKKAVEVYESLLPIKPDFMKQKVLMRLADSCYRIESVPQGLKYLESLEKECKGIYTVSLLKGKYMDLIKDFANATIHF